METAVASIINVLVLSSMYIVTALGFSFLLNIGGIFNFAHGSIYMVGGYICYQFAVDLGLNQWFSLLLAMIIVGSAGILIERLCFRPFYGNLYRIIMVSIALGLILENTVNVLVGAYTRSVPPFVPGILRAGVISVSAERLITLGIGGVFVLILTWFIRRVKAGQQMMAVAQDREGATLQGISVYRMSALACVISCALAAAAGSFMGTLLELSPYMGRFMLVKVIQMVILGGIGSFNGVLIAGLIIGSIDSIVPLFTSGAATDVVGFGIIIVLLLFRPQGLFGREAPLKV
jgi:branched-chain amino acid transport system permease protein